MKEKPIENCVDNGRNEFVKRILCEHYKKRKAELIRDIAHYKKVIEELDKKIAAKKKAPRASE